MKAAAKAGRRNWDCAQAEKIVSVAAQKKKSPQVTKRKMDLLCRINRLQDYFQQGLPVVGRFLAQYLSTWDGEEFFIEICKLLSYLQLTEFIGK